MDKQYYDEYYKIENTHWWFGGRRQILSAVIEATFVPPHDLRWLDVGCGTGSNFDAFAPYGVGFGVDMALEAVHYCQTRGIKSVAAGTSVALPFDSECFDMVTALDVLEHIDDDVAAIREIGRVLRPQGVTVLTVPAYMFLWGRQDQISHHKRRYTTHQVRHLLESAGFSVTRLTYFNTFLFPPIAVVRIGRKLVRETGHFNDNQLVSDFAMTKPGPVNDVLGRVFGCESKLILRHGFPFGVSILAVGRQTC